jgi:hypothetical protein
MYTTFGRYKYTLKDSAQRARKSRISNDAAREMLYRARLHLLRRGYPLS